MPGVLGVFAGDDRKDGLVAYLQNAFRWRLEGLLKLQDNEATTKPQEKKTTDRFHVIFVEAGLNVVAHEGVELVVLLDGVRVKERAEEIRFPQQFSEVQDNIYEKKL